MAMSIDESFGIQLSYMSRSCCLCVLICNFRLHVLVMCCKFQFQYHLRYLIYSACADCVSKVNFLEHLQDFLVRFCRSRHCTLLVAYAHASPVLRDMRDSVV